MRGTGIALISIREGEVHRRTLRIAKKENGPMLLYLQCNEFLEFLRKHTDESISRVFGICTEGAALRSQRMADAAGQVRGAYHLCCMENIWPPAVPTEVPPTSLKKFLAGNGSAQKDKMIQAAQALGWDVDSDDEADAAGLAELAWALHDDTRTLTRKQLEAIKGIRDMDQPSGAMHAQNKLLNI